MKCNYIQVCLKSDIKKITSGTFVLFDKKNSTPVKNKDIVLTSYKSVEIYKDQKNFLGVLSHIYKSPKVKP